MCVTKYNRSKVCCLLLVSCEVLWLRKLLCNFFNLQLDVTYMLYDDQSCVKVSKNLVLHDMLKHTEIKFHYIGDIVQRGEVKLQFVET